jgi:hypothetical protein
LSNLSASSKRFDIFLSKLSISLFLFFEALAYILVQSALAVQKLINHNSLAFKTI